jgi:hypothetical protein
MPPPLSAQNLRHGAAKESLDVAGGEPAVAHTHSTPYESEKTIPTIPIIPKEHCSLVGPVDSPRGSSMCMHDCGGRWRAIESAIREGRECRD